MRHVVRRHWPLLAFLIATGLLGQLAIGQPARVLADSSSNIPGLSLPGPVVSGQLGGSIYDVVFNLKVPSGYVLVANLSSAPGTLFGLYLFDSTATTVQGTQGLVAQSVVVGSSQHVAYPVQGGGTYYIDLNGATNVQGQFTLTVQLVPDSTVPTVSMTLDDGRPATNSPTVSISLTARAGISGVAAMAFSTDGIVWQPWQPYLLATSHTFPTGDGAKHLWVRVRSGIGLVSPPEEASIVLDTVPPTVSSVTPARNSSVGSLRPAISVTFSEPIDPQSWQNLGLVVQGPSGALVHGAYTYDAAALTGTFTPGANLVFGTPYAVTVGPVTDLAGNRIHPVGSWTITPLMPSSATLRASARVLLTGSSVTLSGTVQPPDLPDGHLTAREATGETYAPVAPIPSGAGSFSFSVEPAMNTWYRVDVPGTSDRAAAQSPEVRVIVRRSVTLAGPTASQTRTARSGSPVILQADVEPATAGLTVSFRLYRYDPARGRYVYAGSHGASTTTSGVATIRWLPAAGRYYWRAVVYPTPEFANNITAVYRWVVG